MAEFEIQEEVRDEVRVISIAGDLDIANTDPVREVLEAAAADREHPLVVDLTACDFIDSAGLSTLLAATRPRAKDADLAIAAAAETETRRMLDLTGISLTLPTFDTVDEATSAASSATAR
jgi:stage II sporulation protein AA (anti-sigma F factor antagonist)